MLRNMYFTKFQSLTMYGKNFMGWGKRGCEGIANSKTGLHERESCRPIFKELKVFTVTELYIVEVLIYI